MKRHSYHFPFLSSLSHLHSLFIYPSMSSSSSSLSMNGDFFHKPSSTPFSFLLSLHHLSTTTTTTSTPLPFSSISFSNPFSSKNNPTPEPEITKLPSTYTESLDQFFAECELRPDYRHTPEIDSILSQNPIFEQKPNPTPEEEEENVRFWKQFEDSPVIRFLARAEEVADKVNEMELDENLRRQWKNDVREYWEKVPNVVGLDGRKMPRLALKTEKEVKDKFWLWARNFFLGIWGFRTMPFPPGKPLDVAQALGYKHLEWRYYDFIMKSGGFFYKDRLGRTRGPCELIQLKTAWAGGIIDKHTFVWGEDMDEWAPIGMIYGMERAIATWEVRLGAAATEFLHKFERGIPPWVPLKGQEKKTLQQLQEEAIESKKRDIAVLKAKDGIWPGVRTPSHALFLWASGPELTTILEADHMYNQFIPKHMRQQLAKVIPGLRPWEVLSIEQAMDWMTFGGKWNRKPLTHFKTGPPYIQEWNREVERLKEVAQHCFEDCVLELKKNIPGFDQVLRKFVALDNEMEERWRGERRERRMKRREEEEEVEELLEQVKSATEK